MDVQLTKDGHWRRIGQEQALAARTRTRGGNEPESLGSDELAGLLGRPGDDEEEG